MIKKDIRELIAESAEDALLFDNPSFDNSIIGVSTDGAVIYDLRKMIVELAEDDNISEEEAAEFISYNTLSAYISGAGKMPVVLDDESTRFEIEYAEQHTNKEST